MNPCPTAAQMRDLIEAARGKRPCDLALRGGLVVNVFTGEILCSDVGIQGGRIAAVGANGGIEATAVIDADGLILCPGLIDAHIHLESTMLTPAEFARAVLPLGTTAVVIDPHEIANVAGAPGIRELMAACRNLPLRFYLMIPPAVPASEFETSGARLDAEDMASLAGEPDVLGIAEEMDVAGVLDAREEVLSKLASVPGTAIDGHAPGISDRDLQAYAAAGINSDHECTNHWEALEKLRAGMYLMIREGSAAHNLDELVRLVDLNTERRCLLVSDDLSPADLVGLGHVDHLLRRAVRQGVGPVHAIRMVTLNAAERFGLDRVGAIAPGYRADLAAFEDLSDFRAAFVIAGGEFVAADGRISVAPPRHRFSEGLTSSVHLPELAPEDVLIPDHGGPARVIEAVDGQIITRELVLRPASLGGRVHADVDRDILKIVVVERHGKSGNAAVGLVTGFGLKRGAIASSVAHDSHNVVAVGASDKDIIHAIRRVGEMRGGLAAVAGGEVIADLPLPIGGLMSRASAPQVARTVRRLEVAARDLGCRMTHPFMTLSFMCLSVVPELKITDRGLVGVTRHELVPLFAGELAKAA